MGAERALEGFKGGTDNEPCFLNSIADHTFHPIGPRFTHHTCSGHYSGLVTLYGWSATQNTCSRKDLTYAICMFEFSLISQGSTVICTYRGLRDRAQLCALALRELGIK